MKGASKDMKQKSISAFFTSKAKKAKSGTPTRSKGNRKSPASGKKSAAGKHDQSKENKQCNDNSAPLVHPMPDTVTPHAVTSKTPAHPQTTPCITPVPASNIKQPKAPAATSCTPAAAANKPSAVAGAGKDAGTAASLSKDTSLSNAGASIASGKHLVGTRIKVYWPLDNAWYTGQVQEYDGTKHKVCYDDGDEEWVDLVKENYKMVSPANGTKAKPRRRRAVLMSDDDDDDGDQHEDDVQDSSGADSDFEADGLHDIEDDDVMVDLDEEDDDGDGENADDDGDNEGPTNRKRKLGKMRTSAGLKKATTKKSKVMPDATPPMAVNSKHVSSSDKPPSSAGHTPMPGGFAGFTPPGTTGSATPATPFTCGGSSIAATPNTEARAAMQSALDLTPATSAIKTWQINRRYRGRQDAAAYQQQSKQTSM
eukprot:jgi/Chrzof1/9763/Cz04g14270.t1